MRAEINPTTRQPETKLIEAHLDKHIWEIRLGAELPPLLVELGTIIQSWFDQKQGWQPRRVKGIAQRANEIKQSLVDFLNKGPNQDSPDYIAFYFLFTPPDPIQKKSFRTNEQQRKVDVKRALKGFEGSVHPAAPGVESYWVEPHYFGSLKPLVQTAFYPESTLYLQRALVTSDFRMVPEANDLIDSMPLSRSVVVKVLTGNLYNLLERAISEVKELDKPPTL